MLFVRQKKRLISILLAICFSLSLFMSWGYIISQSEHACTHKNCEVCIKVNNFIEHVNEMGRTLNFGFVTISLCLLCLFLASSNRKSFVTHPTLISLKVRLDI